MASRRFADFYEGALPFQMDRIPEGGMCLSAFLILWKEDARNVLLGKVNPRHDWVRTGALSRKSAEEAGKRWMIPSSHLMLFESPHDAASRILHEQLRLDWRDLGPAEMSVFSEAYSRPKHWDIEFVFGAEVTRSSVPANPAWTVLRFVDVAELTARDFARSHFDIISETRK